MKLRVRFLQLPILFDAARLADEIARLPEAAWRPHPQGFAGNDSLALITTGGDPASDARAGPMLPTPHLAACPYLMQVLNRLGATWGRTRLMRLSGQAEVEAHVDTDYYWRDRMRVHVPIVTQPTVAFQCGDAEVNMAAGECWIFDTWSLHRVVNADDRQRIHLVADTVGGEGLFDLIQGGREPSTAGPFDPDVFRPADGAPVSLDYEAVNAPAVMSPWEMRDHVNFLLGEASPHPALMPVAQRLQTMVMLWQSLWARYGDKPGDGPDGPERYGRLLERTLTEINNLGAADILLKNQMPLLTCVKKLVFNVALASARTELDAELREAPRGSRSPVHDGASIPSPRPASQPAQVALRPMASVTVQTSASSQADYAINMKMGGSVNPPLAASARRPAVTHDPVFDRPVFIVSSPRSGSTLLFETLVQAPGVYSIGGESHELIEGLPALTPAAHGWASNRLDEADAQRSVVSALRERFFNQLKDRDGRAPGDGRIRMLEKTPKNSLRIPFLLQAFPEARFIYLHRDPRQVLASMMEAWSSGRFRTYHNLPGWNGPWSLLLTPGWRDLIGKPLPDVVAGQWSAAMRALLDDLQTLPADRIARIDYDDFVAAPETEARRLAEAVGLDWDRSLGALPHSRHTVSAPRPDKWKAREGEIEAVLPSIAAEMERARAFLKSHEPA